MDGTTRVLRKYFLNSKGNLGCAFFERCLSIRANGGSIRLYCINELLFLRNYGELRKRLLTRAVWKLVARLGPGAFQGVSGEVVNASLFLLLSGVPSTEDLIHGP